MNLKYRQNPVKTEQAATKRPWGDLLSPSFVVGREKKLTRAGTLGTSASVPSMARTRRPFFHSIWEPKRRSYFKRMRSQRLCQKRKESFWRAWQKASSVTPEPLSQRQAAQTSPQAVINPWVMEVVCIATPHISQTTTSGGSARLRWAEHPVAAATAEMSSGVRIRRKGASPNCCKMAEACERPEPIVIMTEPPKKVPVRWTLVTTPSIGILEALSFTNLNLGPLG